MSALEPSDLLGVIPTVEAGEFLIRRELKRGLAGVSFQGHGVVIFPVVETPSASKRTSGQLRVSVEPLLEIRRGDRREVRPAVCIECIDDALIATFCTVAESIDRSLSATGSVTSAAVLEALRQWERLFHARRRLSREEEIGLWGELWFIQSAASVDKSILAWRAPDPSRLDFISAKFAVEVKTSLSGHEHRTSFDQVRSGDLHPDAFLLSLWVAEARDGKSLKDLVDEIRTRASERNEFERRLLRAGFADSDPYSLRLRPVGEPIYVEWKAIPRVRSFDPGALDIRYTITLDPDDLGDRTTIPDIG